MRAECKLLEGVTSVFIGHKKKVKISVIIKSLKKSRSHSEDEGGAFTNEAV